MAMEIISVEIRRGIWETRPLPGHRLENLKKAALKRKNEAHENMKQPLSAGR